ncbi:MAG: hypothetical protein IPG66_00885 [Hydrogenophilales bacterium]|nr:hypothetical protein [Hydrogenophilales bacterium]
MSETARLRAFLHPDFAAETKPFHFEDPNPRCARLCLSVTASGQFLPLPQPENGIAERQVYFSQMSFDDASSVALASTFAVTQGVRNLKRSICTTKEQ